MRIAIGIFLLAILLGSCGEADFFNESRPIEGQSWAYKNKLSFTVDVTDTISPFNVFIDFRNNDNYPYSDIYFFFDIDFPNGKHANDTIFYPVMDRMGKWHGKNSGSIVDNHILIKPNIIFPLKGKYTMHIRHAMRDENLAGVEDVGLSISSNTK